jgi:hypothetical protein
MPSTGYSLRWASLPVTHRSIEQLLEAFAAAASRQAQPPIRWKSACERVCRLHPIVPDSVSIAASRSLGSREIPVTEADLAGMIRGEFARLQLETREAAPAAEARR